MRVHTRKHRLLLAAICVAGNGAAKPMPISAINQANAVAVTPVKTPLVASRPNAIVFEEYGILKIGEPQGAGKRDLASSKYAVEALAVSPNGRLVAYSGGERSDRLTVLDLWTQHRWISRGSIESFVSWAPDSERLAYSGAKGELRVWSLKDGTDRLVSMRPTFPYASPVWSPRDDLIAVTRYRPGPDGFGELRFVSVKKHRLLSVRPCGQWRSLSWAPDGRRIAGAYRASANSNPFAAVVSVKTGRVSILRGTGGTDELAWAPRGPWIAVSRFLRDTGQKGGQWEGELILANPTFGARRSLHVGQFTGLFWHPTAQKLLYTGWVEGHRSDVWELDVRTRAARPVMKYAREGQYAVAPGSAQGNAPQEHKEVTQRGIQRDSR